MSTEQLLSGLSGQVASWRGFVSALPNFGPEERENVGKIFDLVTRIIKDSGIEDVSGLGVSSIATEKSFYHSTVVLHHYPEKGGGFLWNIGGGKSHALTALDLLPAETALASFSDVDLALLWSVIQKEVGQSGFAEAEAFVEKLPTAFERSTGLDWNRALNSLGGEFGFAVTLDESNKTVVPLPGKEPLEIPGVGLMVAVKVKDDTIFTRVEQALTDSKLTMEKVDEPGLKLRTVIVPLPFPVPLRPSIAAAGGYVFIASTDSLIRDALAVKSGRKPGLRTTDEFKRLARDIPEQGNRFTWLSERFGRTIQAVQQRVLGTSAAFAPAQQAWLESLLSSNRAAFSYTVGANTGEGWISVANGNQNPGKILGASVLIAPVGLLSAIAIPNFIKARQTSQRNACISNLRRIEDAKRRWAQENNKTDADTPSEADLRTAVFHDGLPVCPQGGHYTIGRVGEHPTCSIPGHSLPD